MADKKISIEFKNGMKIITHPDGSVKEYSKADAEKHKDYLLKRRDDVDRQITHVDEDIANIEKSKKA
jgi:hypothetical protein